MLETKTLGSTGARLITELAQREPPVFTLGEAQDVLGASGQVTSNLLSRLVRQGWVVRVRRGVYEVAPIWATRESFAADRFAGLSLSLQPPYYVAYRSALELYGWLQHLVVGRLWIAVPQPRRVLRTPRDRVVWVVTKPDRFEWGVRDSEVAAALVRAWPTIDEAVEEGSLGIADGHL